MNHNGKHSNFALLRRSLAWAALAVLPALAQSSNVGLTSATPSVCTMLGAQLRFFSAGNCRINGLARAAQSISFGALSSLTLDSPAFDLAATASSLLPVEYASSDLSVCSVFGSTVVLAAAGTCTITAAQPGNALYLPATPVIRSFTVLPTPPCAYALTPARNSFPAAPGTGTIAVVTGPSCAWSASASAPFLTFTSPASGTGSDTIAYSVSANTTGSARSGNVTIAGQVFPVTQFAAGCGFATNTSSIDFGAGGGSATIGLQVAGSGCSWAATSSDTLNLTVSPAAGTVSQQVLLTVTPNLTNTTRNLTALIGGQTVAIRQAAANCTVALGATAAVFAAGGGQGSVGISVPAACAYTAANSPPWVTLLTGSFGSGPGGTLFYSVQPNSTRTARTGTLLIGGAAFSISQAGAVCDLGIDTAGLPGTFPSQGFAGAIGVDAAALCSWTASSSVPWLTISAPSSGTGAGQLSYFVAPNESNTRRSGRLQVGSQVITIAQAGAVCAFTLRSAAGNIPAAGGTGAVGLLTDSRCNWTASGNAAWLTPGSASGTGSAEVAFTAAANTSSASRTGAITIGGQSFTVQQAGAGCAFTLASIAASAAAASPASASVGIATTASGCTVSAVSYAGWLSAATTFSGQAGSFTWSAQSNTGPARTGIIRVADQTFTVTQAGASCIYTLASPGALHGQAAGSGSAQFTAAGSGCATTASAAGSIALGALTGPVGGVYTLGYTFPQFSSATAAVRTSQISIGGRVFTVKQTSW